MAPNPQITEQQIESLVARAEAARHVIGGGLRTLRHKAYVTSRIKNSFRAHPLICFSTAALGGLVLARLFRRRSAPAPAPVTSAPRGIRHFALQALFSAAKPLLQQWLTQQVKKNLSSRFQKTHSSPSNR